MLPASVKLDTLKALREGSCYVPYIQHMAYCIYEMILHKQAASACQWAHTVHRDDAAGPPDPVRSH